MIITKWIISLVAISLAIAHIIFPGINIDNLTLLFFLVAILPWIFPIVKSVDVPGVGKIEFREVRRITEQAERVGLIEVEDVETRETTNFVFERVADQDPNLALAGLRIQIERSLSRLAEANGIRLERASIRQYLDALVKRELVSAEEKKLLLDLTQLLNSAVHGAKIETEARDYAINTGRRILINLAARIKASFIIQKSKRSDFGFRLIGPDRDALIYSESYRSKAGCLNGINAVRRLSPDLTNYEVERTAKEKKYFFTIRAKNHEIVAVSDVFNSREEVDIAINQVKVFGPEASVVNLED